MAKLRGECRDGTFTFAGSKGSFTSNSIPWTALPMISSCCFSSSHLAAWSTAFCLGAACRPIAPPSGMFLCSCQTAQCQCAGRTAQPDQCYQAWECRAGQGHWRAQEQRESELLVSFRCLFYSCTHADGFLTGKRLVPGLWVAATDCFAQNTRQRANSRY